MIKRIEVSIFGFVQGVSFRYYAAMEAERLGLRGEVWNEKNDSVRIIAEGQEKALMDLVAWCRHGPTRAAVKEVKVKWMEPKNEFQNFRVSYSN